MDFRKYGRRRAAPRKRGMDGGVTGLYRTMCNYGMQALALGLITWEEYKTATNQ